MSHQFRPIWCQRLSLQAGRTRFCRR